MSEEHRKPKKYAHEGTTKVSALVRAYVNEEGDIKWFGQVEFGQVTLVHITNAPSDTLARSMLVQSLAQACDDINALKDAIQGNIQRV